MVICSESQPLGSLTEEGSAVWLTEFLPVSILLRYACLFIALIVRKDLHAFHDVYICMNIGGNPV